MGRGAGQGQELGVPASEPWNEGALQTVPVHGRAAPVSVALRAATRELVG